MRTLELSVRRPLSLKLGDEGYLVEFPHHIIADLEKELGRSLLGANMWLGMHRDEVPVVLAAGLRTHYPESAVDLAKLICDSMDGNGLEETIKGFAWVNYPKTMEEIEAIIAKTRGTESPKDQSAGDPL